MGLQFHETMYGKTFFEHQLPRLTKAIEKLAESKNTQGSIPVIPFPLADEETCKRLIAVMDDSNKAEAFATLGKNIRKYRHMKGLRQEDLAVMCDCTNSHIGQIENARGIPSLEMTVRIANSLEVTVDQLLSTSYASPEKVFLKEVLERIEKYPLKKRIKACEGLITYLDTLEKFGE